MSGQILMATARRSFKHDFSIGEFLIKKSLNGDLTHFVVDEIISDERIKVRAVMRDGLLSNSEVIVFGKELKSFVSNYPINNLKRF